VYRAYHSLYVYLAMYSSGRKCGEVKLVGSVQVDTCRPPHTRYVWPLAGSGAVSKWVICACDSLVDFGAV